MAPNPMSLVMSLMRMQEAEKARHTTDTYRQSQLQGIENQRRWMQEMQKERLDMQQRSEQDKTEGQDFQHANAAYNSHVTAIRHALDAEMRGQQQEADFALKQGIGRLHGLMGVQKADAGTVGEQAKILPLINDFMKNEGKNLKDYSQVDTAIASVKGGALAAAMKRHPEMGDFVLQVINNRPNQDQIYNTWQNNVNAGGVTQRVTAQDVFDLTGIDRSKMGHPEIIERLRKQLEELEADPLTSIQTWQERLRGSRRGSAPNGQQVRMMDVIGTVPGKNGETPVTAPHESFAGTIKGSGGTYAIPKYGTSEADERNSYDKLNESAGRSVLSKPEPLAAYMENSMKRAPEESPVSNEPPPKIATSPTLDEFMRKSPSPMEGQTFQKTPASPKHAMHDVMHMAKTDALLDGPHKDSIRENLAQRSPEEHKSITSFLAMMHDIPEEHIQAGLQRHGLLGGKPEA